MTSRTIRSPAGSVRVLDDGGDVDRCSAVSVRIRSASYSRLRAICRNFVPYLCDSVQRER